MELERKAQPGWRLDVAKALRDGVDFIAHDVLDMLVSRRFGSYDASAIELESVRANLLGIAETLERGVSAEVPAAALRVAQRGAARGLQERTLTLIYYTGQSRIWDRHLLPLIADADISAEELVHRSRVGFALLADYLEGVEQAVIDRLETERHLLKQPLHGADLVLSVLSGSDPGCSIEGYPTDAIHLAVVVWTTERGDDAVSELHRTFALVRSLAPRIDQLRFDAASNRLVLWFALFDDASAHGLLERLRNVADVRAGVGIAIGMPARGLPGFRSTYEDAEETRVLLVRNQITSTRVAVFSDIALASALLSDRRRAERFVAMKLEALTGEENRTLRETVYEFLRNDSSYSQSAVKLQVHRNTVYKRIEKVRHLSGSLSGTNALELYAALVVERLLWH